MINGKLDLTEIMMVVSRMADNVRDELVKRPYNKGQLLENIEEQIVQLQGLRNWVDENYEDPTLEDLRPKDDNPYI